MAETCNCKKDIEAKLLARFKESTPDASDHGLELKGYALVITDDAVEQKGYMIIKATANYPLKKGGYKLKSAEQSMVFTFCPFCGVKY
jgi:hypothetical protein